MDTLFTLAVFSFSFLLFFIKFPYFLHDCVFMMKSLRVRSKRMNFRKSVPYYTVLDCFVAAAHRHPHKPFVVFEDDVYTYQQVDRWSNRAAHALRKHTTLREGDTAALLMANEPHFIFLCLGLMKIGCSTSLLNTNIRGKSLTHCFLCCEAKVLIAGAEYRSAVCEVLPELRKRGVSVFLLCDNCDFDGVQSLKDKMDISEDGPVSHTLRANITMKSPAFYIYTSGTTGLPKAGVILHERIWSAAFFQSLFGVKPDDVIYIPLPLYHAAGLIIGLGGAIERGITVVLRKKFSVSQFWTDCRKHNVTVIQYIGEIMRYLCNTPKTDGERVHNVRLALGNGIRADTWVEFLQRFGDMRICECYGATEANIGLVNYVGKIGSVGRASVMLKRLAGYSFIKYNSEREEPVRDSRGFCVEVSTGETGLLVGKITKMAPFNGYANSKQQTEKKKLRNVFKHGDVYFNTGDLMKVDEQGFVYFQDRIGDTFRWKGENVATTEVADVLVMVDFIEEANVYGVRVPGHEGRIGMAAIKLKEGWIFDGSIAYKHVESYLPAYARPRFIRVQDMLNITGTYKQVKLQLAEEGFDPKAISDEMYFLDDRKKIYVPMTEDIFNSIYNGHFRL